MKRLSVVAGAFLLSCTFSANAATYIYDLNNSYFDQTNSTQLTPLGGSLGSAGYTFGANQGLSLNNVLPSAGPYSIDIKFTWDSVSALWQKIIDFANLTSDNGLYTFNGHTQIWSSNGTPTSASTDFTAGVQSDVLLTNDGVGNVSVKVNGFQVESFFDVFFDLNFTGPNNVANFFVDDVTTGQNEAAGGVVRQITVTTGVPEPTTWAMMLLGFAGLGFVAYRRRARPSLMVA